MPDKPQTSDDPFRSFMDRNLKSATMREAAGLDPVSDLQVLVDASGHTAADAQIILDELAKRGWRLARV